MTKLTFGTGRIQVARGTDTEGENRSKYLLLKDLGKEHPVGARLGGEAESMMTPTTLDEHDVVLEFQTLASARVLADKLNLLVCKWDDDSAREAYQKQSE